MTIDSAWVKLFKERFPQAFHKKCPIEAQVVFIDAQIKLPKAENVTTWQELVHRNFLRPVKRWYDLGAKTVVLAFDDYNFVPRSKGMTQCKRRRHIPPKVVNAHDALPPVIPGDYMELIMNRVFKTKVINLVCEYLPKLLKLAPDQTLIIDWDCNALRFQHGSEQPSEDESLPPLGECDCKATRYARFGNLLIDTTDGDYIPISLMFVERAMREARVVSEARAPGEARGISVSVPSVAIYRMECKTKAVQAKRKAAGDDRPRITYEFVHVNHLLRHLQAAFDGMPMGSSPWATQARLGNVGNLHGVEMCLLTMLIAFTGTDFSKGLPYLSPQKIWDALQQGLLAHVVGCFDRDSLSLDVEQTCDRVIARLYAQAYRKHVREHDRMLMADVATQLKDKSALSASVRERLPSLQNTQCLVRNANWLMQYWQCADDGKYPDPMAGDFGFALNKKGQPVYADDLPPS